MNYFRFLCLRQRSGRKHYVSRVFVRASVRACVSLKQTLLAIYFLTEFDQTFTTNGHWGKDKNIRFWGQNVKGQNHSEVKYASKCTF